MYRYLSLIWDTENSKATATAKFIAKEINARSEPWAVAYRHHGVRVFHTGERPGQMQAYPLTNKKGVILGKLFDRHFTPRAPGQSAKQNLCSNALLDDLESREISDSEGRALINRFWGRYVAFLKDPESGTTRVLRDPSGGYPCLYISYNGVTIFFSFMKDVVDFDFLNFTINWDYIAAYMKFEVMLREDTGLEQISELMAGKCLELSHHKKKNQLYWDACEIARNNIIEDTAEAAQVLRNTTINCVASWASSYKNILLRLSGGLDSSIVLSCLRKTATSPEITCINSFTTPADGDERHYARISADYCQTTLIEHEQKIENEDLNLLFKLIFAPSPSPSLFCLDRSQCENNLAQEIGAEAVFSGGGGDGIFYQPKTNFSASDYVKMHGIRPALFKISLEAARLQQRSVWAVLYDAIRDNIIKGSANPFAEYFNSETSILTPTFATKEDIQNQMPSWIKKSTGLPNGKLFHISMIAPSPLYHEPRLNGNPFLEPVNPLCSQPLLEACLRIPTWIMTTGGKDRGLTRLAFHKDIAPATLQRVTKGTNTRHFMNVFDQNIPLIRNILMNGILMKEGILNRKNLENSLSGSLAFTPSERMNILCHFTTEAWLQSWYNRKYKIAV